MIKNPYYELFRHLEEVSTELIGAYASRKTLVQEFAWAIPSNNAIEKIKSYSQKIIEIGAGSGYWAKLLADEGVDVIAFDDRSFTGDRDNIWLYEKTALHYPVGVGSVEMIAANPDRDLLLCWPDYDSDFAFQALKEFKSGIFFYIGEDEGGCTGCDEFHEELKKLELLEVIGIPNWHGIRDALYIYRKLGG